MENFKEHYPDKSKRHKQSYYIGKERNGRYTSAEYVLNLFNEHFVSIADNIIEHNIAADCDLSILKELISPKVLLISVYHC